MGKFTIPSVILISAVFVVIVTETETSTLKGDEETVTALVPKEKKVYNAMVSQGFPQFQSEKGNNLKFKYS
jgi:hypothetical protein